MKWCEAYIQMKDNNAFVRRKVWGKGYIAWLKPASIIKEEWCKDEKLKKLISNFGHIDKEGKKLIEGEQAICLFNGRSVETGWNPRNEDKVSEDWEIVNLD